MEHAALSPGSVRCNGGQEGFPPPLPSATIPLSSEGGAVARGVLLLAPEEEESRRSTSAARGKATRGRIAPRKIPIENRRKIVDSFQHGVSVSEIAREFGVSECGVRKTWARYATTGSLRDKGAGRRSGNQQRVGAANGANPPLEEEEEVDSGVGSQETVVGMGCGSSLAGQVREGVLEANGAPPLLPSPSRPMGLPSFSSGESQDLSSPMTPMDTRGEPPVSTLLFDSPQLDKDRIGPVPPNYSLLHIRRGRSRRSLNRPYSRERMLPRIEGCPLDIIVRKQCNTDQRHMTNIPKALARPLYGECLWGFPFGRAPEASVFQCSFECLEDNPIISDPTNPPGKDLLVELGYSTQLYLNACCKPPSSLSPEKIAACMPFSLAPATLSEATQKFFQTMLDLSRDPFEVLSRVPEGQGLAVTACGAHGETTHRRTTSPRTLSQYWLSVMDFATNVLQCCENFVSAAPSSVPCLVCHPFVREPTPPPSPPPTHTAVSPRGTQPPEKKLRSSSSPNPLSAGQDDMDVSQSTSVSPVLSTVEAVSMLAEATQPSFSIPPLLTPTSRAHSPSHAPGATLSSTTPSMSFLGSSPSLPLPQAPALPQATTRQLMWLFTNKSLLGLSMTGQQQSMGQGGFPANPPLQWPPSAHVSFTLPSTTGSLQLPRHVSSVVLPPRASLGPLPFSPLPTQPAPQSAAHPLSPLSASQAEKNNATVSSSEQHLESSPPLVQQDQPSFPEHTVTKEHTNGQGLRESTRGSSGKGRPGRQPALTTGKRTTRSQTKRPLPSASPPPPSHPSPPSSTIQEETSNANVLVPAPPTEPLDVGPSLPSAAPPQQWTCAEVKDFIERVTDQRCSKVFLDQEVDGASLMLLTTDVLVNMMKIKIGPAVKIMRHIEALRR